MTELVRLRTRDLTVASVLELKREYVDQFKSRLQLAAETGDTDTFNNELAATFQRDPFYTGHQTSKNSICAIWNDWKPNGDWPIDSWRRSQRLAPRCTPEPFARRVLEEALKACNITTVRMLLGHGMNLNESYPQQSPPHTEYERFSFELKDYFGTPLHAAAQFSTPKICSLLMQSGADPFVEDTEEIGSCADGQCIGDPAKWVVTAKQLIALGAEISATDLYGRTALHYAIRQPNVDLTLYLIVAGVEVNQLDGAGWTALHELASRRHNCPYVEDHDFVERQRTILNLLLNSDAKSKQLKTEDTFWQDPAGGNPHSLLSLAIGSKNWLITELLLDKGAQCTQQELTNEEWVVRAMRTAARDGGKSVVRHLLDADFGTLSSLHTQSWPPPRGDHIRRVLTEALTFYQDIVGPLKGRCLHQGSPNDYSLIIKMLIDAGLDGNHEAACQYDPLRTAFHLRSPTVFVSWLLEAGSDVSLQGSSKDSQFDILLTAALSGNYDNFALVCSKCMRNNDIDQPFGSWRQTFDPTWALEGPEAMADCVAGALMQHGDLEYPDKSGWTLLHKAAFYNNVPLARALVKHGAKVEAREPVAEWNALLIATTLGHEQMVKCLLESGLDPNAKADGLLDERADSRGFLKGIEGSSEFGGTPLIVALLRLRGGLETRIVRLLLDYGADVNSRVTGNLYRTYLDHGMNFNFNADIENRTFLLSPSALAIAAMKVFDHSKPRQKGEEAQVRSVIHKAIGGKLPEELVEMTSDHFLADIEFDERPRELVKLLLDRGADAKDAADQMGLADIAKFTRGYEDPWDNRLRQMLQGDGVVFEYDPRL